MPETNVPTPESGNLFPEGEERAAPGWTEGPCDMDLNSVE